MRRPVVRFVLTLLAAASILGSVPATSEAGIIPWAWDTLFGPVGSIQARRAGYYGGAYYGGGYYGGGYSAGCCSGPSQYVGFRGWRNGCCGSNYGGYSSYGYGCSSCGGCSSCSTGGCGYDCGYACGSCGTGCGVGGCASGQCNVNYPPGTTPPAGAGSPVTPAVPPGGGATGGPSPGYDTNVVPPAPPMAPGPGPAPAGAGAGADATQDGFRAKSPAPPMGDPTQGETFIPPNVKTDTDANSPSKPADNGAGTDANGTTTTVPPVPAAPNAKKRPTLTDEDKDDKDKMGGGSGPRLEMQEKITWQRTVVRVRQAQVPNRVTASANRTGMFPRMAWRATVDTELAKK